MSMLIKGLTVVDESRPQNVVGNAIEKFIEVMKKQIGYLESEAKGEALPPKARKLYWNKNGQWYVQCSYGTEKIDLGGGSAVKAGPKVEDAVKVFNTLIDNADGALKDAIHAAADKMSAKLTGRKKGTRK